MLDSRKCLNNRSIFSARGIVSILVRKVLQGIDIVGVFHSKLSLEQDRGIDLNCLAIVLGNYRLHIEVHTSLVGSRRSYWLGSRQFLGLGKRKHSVFHPRILELGIVHS